MPRAPFPLQWPDGHPRTRFRERSAFDLGRGFNAARDGTYHQLSMMSASHVVITSNMPVSASGKPYTSNQGNISDPGIAVWWVQRGNEYVLACDRWRSATENMRSIEKSLEAMRGLSRWGASQIVERAFAGFAALPPGSGDGPIHAAPRTWREVLDMHGADFLPKSDQLVLARSRYRDRIANVHPDRGGTHEQAAELGAALAAAEKELTA